MMTGKLLFAVLDWGLGHATRSIPIIETLVEAGFEVHLAGNGSSSDIIRKQFPTFPFWELPGYDPRYSKGHLLPLGVASQIPDFLKTIALEHEKLNQMHQRVRFDLVISDNRYGCYLKELPSVFICHQLTIPLKGIIKPFSPLVQYCHRLKFASFDELWVPDQPGIHLSGEMSAYNGPLPVEFIGLPTRFETCPDNGADDFVLAVLSGPEPQRTVFEQRLFQQMQSQSESNFVLIRGKAGQVKAEQNVRVIPFAHKAELQKLICQASYVISRSGYSSIIDLMQLEKPALLIPTPGMPEQEYLAKRVQQLGWFDTARQSDFKLEKSIQSSRDLMEL
jgi:UDP:flavonoid glycosyltransferase YjiC (YdhE family)